MVGKLLFVHAGMETREEFGSVAQQLCLLDAKDIDRMWVENVQGRSGVQKTRADLKESHTMVVSGHHNRTKIDVENYRIILDTSGGDEFKPLGALILPECKLVETQQRVIYYYLKK